MNKEDFKKYGYQMVDWVADYLSDVENIQPVKSQVNPGEIYEQLPEHPPLQSESIETTMADFNRIIFPGITHWQHPNFHAYFPANVSEPSILAEILTAGMGLQCMVWDTSPAAAELEERMMDWLKEMMDLPREWHGVIQDTASTATLAALLTAREVKTNYQVNKSGFESNNLRIYCSTETHSSIDKAVKIAGFGAENLIKIAVDDHLKIIPEKLEEAIKEDIENGLTPCAIVGTAGSTGTLAFDDLATVGEVAKKYDCWYHIDAAYAGPARILPECRDIMEVELADSYVFNPHKWLMVNFDCSAYYVKDKEALIKTFEILPEYLKTSTRGKVNDYRDWGVPLGRRFRALKLWFVFRYYGIEGLQEIIRNHNELAEWFEEQVIQSKEFELLVPRALNVVIFRCTESNDPNALTKKLMEEINDRGELYLSHIKVRGDYGIRMVTGQTKISRPHVEKAWRVLNKTLKELKVD